MATPRAIDGRAPPVPGDPLPMGSTRGRKLVWPNQLDLIHKFMSMPIVPCYAGDPHRGGDGFSLQRVLDFSIGKNWFVSLLGQFDLQKLVSSFRGPSSSHSADLMKHLCDKSLYSLGLCLDFFIDPDCSVFLSSEANGNKGGRRNKAVLHQKLPQHDFTLEASSPGLFVDNIGNYWDVPLSIAIDLASLASKSGSSYHLCIHHNNGQPEQFSGDETGVVPPYLLPGVSAKAAFSIKKDGDIWRNRGKLKIGQPYDFSLSDPHVSVSGIIGMAANASLRDVSLSADSFGSFSCSAQYGNFQRFFFDLTRLNARLDFPSGCKFIAGAASLADNFYKSLPPSMEAVRAICPNVMLSLQQQIAGPISFRVDSRISLGSMIGDRFALVDDSVFSLEYAMKVLRTAKASAWYSAKDQKYMVELRFFEG